LTDSTLARLAELAGIEAGYWDVENVWHETAPLTMQAILLAMGLKAGSEADAAESLHALQDAPWRRTLEPVTVVRPGAGTPAAVTVVLPEASAAALTWTLACEDGTSHGGTVLPRDLERLEQRATDAGTLERRRLPLPEGLPEGYHTLSVEGPGGTGTASLVVAPARAYMPDWVRGGGRAWGVACHLYTLTSARNWGMGDFGDLARLADGMAGQGADAVGLNPMHALFPGNPEHASPYSPSSRRYLNPLFIDVTVAPGYGACAEAQRLMESAEFREGIAAARRAELVDYATIGPLKEKALAALHGCLGDHPEARADFAAFKEAGGRQLHRFGVFEVLQERFGSTPWHQWPTAYQDPESETVAQFASHNAGAVDFRLYLQWLADRQFGAAQRTCHERGMHVGLYRDLAVGSNPDGADTWTQQGLFVTGASFGAPPDPLNAFGQDWGVPPLSPLALKERAYQPFIDIVRGNMRHAGALRMDHAMGLMHLFWQVRRPDNSMGGAYVRYPFEDLLGILALESQRNACLVVGEDLGTVPAGFRERMSREGILSYRLMYFERQEHGVFKPPHAYPALALATPGTHDLHTILGHWQGRDITVRRKLSLFPDDTARAEAERDRVTDRQRLIDALHSENLLPEGYVPDEDLTPLIVAIHRYLARSPACLMMVNLDDLAVEADQINVPGTVTEYPNWRRRLSAPLETLLEAPLTRAVAAAVNREEGRV